MRIANKPNAVTIAAMKEGRKILNSKTKSFSNAEEMFAALERKISNKKVSKCC